MEDRPELNKELTPADFKAFYWLKKELVDFCRTEGLHRSGDKIEITKRIVQYLASGEKAAPHQKVRSQPQSKFDWNREQLTTETIITDTYKNSENVRAFFVQAIGKQFKFNVTFMNWMKTHTGKTLKEAIAAWKRIHQDKTNNTQAKEIAPQFEYNTYLRDFLADNPTHHRATGISLWNIKKTMRGNNKYHKDDLKWLSKGTA